MEPTETPQTLVPQMDAVQLLDCRNDDEWQAGRIDGAVHLPLPRLMAGEDGGLDPARPVVGVCRSGARSQVGTLMLMARGFDARNLLGGMEAWAAAGMPVVAPDGSPGRVI